MTTATRKPWSIGLEHAGGYHDNHPIRHCPECYPDGKPTFEVSQPDAPAPVVARPRWQLRPHTFRWTSMRTVDGEAVCECSSPKSAEVHGQAEAGGLYAGLNAVVANLAARSGQPRFRDEEWTDPYADMEPSDGGPNCSTCHGFRRGRRDVPLDHPDFGKMLECPSPECAAWLAQQRLDKLLGTLPPHFQGWDFDMVATRYPLPEVGQRMADWGRNWLAIEADPPPSAVLHGKSGRGKTVLAVAMLKAFIAQPGHTGAYQYVPQLLRLVRSTYGSRDGYNLSERDILAALHQVDLLVLDDLGRENDNDWASELLAEVIEGRYQRRLRMIITSNWSVDELADRIGVPSASRIAEMAPDEYRRDFGKLPNLRQPEKGDRPS